MNSKALSKKFPEYFRNFILPEGAREESILSFRACRSGKTDRDSFLPTFEENGYKCPEGFEETEPSIYSLSVYGKPKDVKRFVAMTSDFKVPYRIAVGYTNPVHGVVQPTKERTKCKSSHIDWWLYEDAEPYIEYSIIDDFDSYMGEYKRGSDNS